ncbi:MAG: hypothetical protein UU37_C0002G0015 [Candidatus Gottesmanbacteria bacterium GW2011_GWA2_41_12]|uniref:Adenylate kinase n=2 Tax=Candidatus Gottesmaniibacteriota TaxID=1752720 RepID=A0A0G0WVP9_9BACT|nr:MAG: hypothetical protein UT63_C0013G0002 [Candidatus Gottesmanbacteria bacterium GW2011_GWC2_39_8]KKR88500.1 MAG: hypothetical protein UU37_C0002G0015 [Candidatus Gottesmanbacteria bacterium GW2011_GWA2_41_12]
MKLVLMGIQGSGKSTQGNLLSERLKIPYLSSGHIFREMAKEKTKWGRYVKETLNAGFLIPDDKAIPIIEEYLTKPEYQNGFILDGFPRTLKQAKKFSQKMDKAVYLKVSDREALWRISYRNDDIREDDTIIAIRKRIELFHKVTEPVLGYYKKIGILTEVNGELHIREVFKRIMDSLGPFIPKTTVKNNGKLKIIALVGMPGAGKTVTADFFRNKHLPVLRFGDETDKVLSELGLPLTEENERKVREKLRNELGMAAYARKIIPRIEKETQKGEKVIVLDGMRSFEEFTFLKKKFSCLKVLHIYARPEMRSKRLSNRKERRLTPGKLAERDVAEIVNLNMGGPIALADFSVENDSTLGDLHDKLEKIYWEMRR